MNFLNARAEQNITVDADIWTRIAISNANFCFKIWPSHVQSMAAWLVMLYNLAVNCVVINNEVKVYVSTNDICSFQQ